jgi:hypothetical protein
MTERPAGLYVDATQTVWRMDPGTTMSVELVATRFGAPLPGHTLSLAILDGEPTSALTFPKSVETDTAGRATVPFSAEAPSRPRGEHLDGQHYQVGFFEGATSPSRILGLLTYACSTVIP